MESDFKPATIILQQKLNRAAESGRVRCDGRLGTGSGPRGSSHNHHRLGAIDFPAALRGELFSRLTSNQRKMKAGFPENAK